MDAGPVSVCALCEKDSSLGFVLYESIKGTLSLTEVHPTELLVMIPRIIQLFNPTHFLVPESFQELTEELLKDHERIERVVLPKHEFSFKQGTQSLNSMFLIVPDEEQENMRKAVASGIIDMCSKATIACISAITNFLKETSLMISVFKTLHLPHGLTIDDRSLAELQIFAKDYHPSIHNPMASKEGLSLFSYLNRCSTAMGRSTLRSWFILTNTLDIEKRLDLVEHFIQPSVRPHVNEIMKQLQLLPEVRQLLIKLKKGTMQKGGWLRLHNGLVQTSKLCSAVSNAHMVDFEHLDNDTSAELQRIATDISSTIDLEEPQNTVKVRDENEPELTRLRKNYNNLDIIMERSLQKMIRNLPNPRTTIERVVYIPQQGFLAILTKDSAVPDDYRVQFETETQVFAKNEHTDALDSDIGDIYQDIQACEIRILVNLANKILGFSHLLQSVWESIGKLDAVCSLAIVAVEANYVRPVFSATGELNIVNGRHPLLERINPNFVPNTTAMPPGESTIHVITGPNSSGKSVYLKQVALITYMAHIGSFVPADHAVIPVTDHIFTLFHNPEETHPFNSSFMSEISHIAEVIGKATSNSLVFIDEFGKTSTKEDGSSLLAGFIHFMGKKEDCPKIFLTTHFHNIFEQRLIPQDCYILCSMEVRMNEDLLFLYQLQKGNADRDASSFGLHCAKRAGLSQEIVDRASVIVSCYENGREIQPDEKCFDRAQEERVKYALEPFFLWNGRSKPRELLDKIDRRLHRQ